MMPANIAQGIEVITTMVLRQLPRNSRIIRLTSSEASTASKATFLIAARTNCDWSKSRLICMSPNPAALAPARMSSSRSRVASTTARLEASACLRIVR